MPINHEPAPRNAPKAALTFIIIIVAMVAVIFVGMNFYHAHALKEQQSGHQADPQAKPHGPHDLEVEPPHKK